MRQEREASRVSRREFLAGSGLAIGTAFVGSEPILSASAEETVPVIEEKVESSVQIPQEFTTYDTDVLVIGAGSAGVQAAIYAAETGANVIIVEKKHYTRCGPSGMHAFGRMTSPAVALSEGDSVEEAVADGLETHKWVMDQDWAEALMIDYEKYNPCLESENYGNIHNRDSATGEPVFNLSTTKPRLWEGYKLDNHATYLYKLGVKIFEYTTVTNLLTDRSGVVVGATALDFHTGDFIVYKAKATILATGEPNQIFGAGTISALYSGRPITCTGDGRSMAARVGAEMKDLEFYCGGYGVIWPTAVAATAAFANYDTTQFTDKDGNLILADIPAEEMTIRRRYYEYEKMIVSGKAGPHGGYLSAPPEWTSDQVPKGGAGLTLEDKGFFVDDWLALGLIWERNGLEHVEQLHYVGHGCGGIYTNTKAETSVPGLYACGGEYFGWGADGCDAYRGFSNIFVTGRWAGKNAGERAIGFGGGVDIQWNQVADEYKRVYSLLYSEPEKPVRAWKIKKAIQDAAWMGAGVWRSEKRCNEAFALLDKIETEDFPNIYVQDKSKVCNLEWIEALEAFNMMDLVRMTILAAITRTESRVYAIRNEYPDMDNDNWLKNIIIKLKDGKPEVVRIQDTVITKWNPPRGKFPQGGGTIDGI